MQKTLMLILGAVFAFEVGIAEESAQVTALKLTEALVLDGRLDEPFWRAAEPLGDFHVFSKDDPGRRLTDTEVRLAYDDAWLYLGIKCDNPLQELVLNPKVREHDGPVHTDESVELFFYSDGTGKVYYHFMLSCFNVKAEQRIIDGVRERQTWNQPWRSATVITDEGWTAEVAIPLYVFMEYGDLDHIRLNIARNRRMPFMDDCNAITHEAMEHSLWQPVRRSFHELDVFGSLAPLAPDKLRTPFQVVLERAVIHPYYTEDEKHFYQVEITVKGANPTPGQMELVITDQPVAGTGSIVRELIDVRGTTPLTLTLAVPVTALTSRSIAVEILDGDNTEKLHAIVIENPVILDVMRGWLDRNYYTSETMATAMTEIGMPAEALKDLLVVVKMDGKPLASAPAAREVQVEFPAAGLAEGIHPVSITLQRKDGVPFAAINVELLKRAPNPGREVKLDQIDRVVLTPAGTPIFPFGPIMAGIQPDDDAAFKEIADAGCNTFFQWNKNLPAEDAVKYLERARQHGLWGISMLETGWMTPADAGMRDLPDELQKALSAADIATLTAMTRKGELGLRAYLINTPASRHSWPVKTGLYSEYVNRNMPVSVRMMKSVMQADNLLAYSSFDEPYDSRRFDMTQSLADIYRLTHQTDGYRPVKLLYYNIWEGDEYVEPCDILVTDPYWAPAGIPGRDTPNYVSSMVLETDRRAEKFRRVVWIVNIAGVNWSGTRKRVITGPEQQSQDFLAIIHGAKGLFWFRYPMPDVAWVNLKDSMAKVKVIGPMAVQPAVRQNIKYLRATAPSREWQPAPFIPERHEFPDVQAKIFRDPQDGSLVLVAANSRYYPVTAMFTVSGLTGQVRRIFADMSFTPSADVFSEELEPFAVRAYRLGSGLAEPVELTVSSLRPEEIPPMEDAGWPNNVRQDKKNIFPNPSFAETSVAGLPDYYFGEYMLDTSGQAKFGANCLKMTNEVEWVTWACAPQHERPMSYVWSFWAKGERGGEQLEAGHFSGVNYHPGQRKKITLTQEWQRFKIPTVMPAHQRGTRADFGILLGRSPDPDHPYVVWLDGFQLEQGETMTDFED